MLNTKAIKKEINNSEIYLEKRILNDQHNNIEYSFKNRNSIDNNLNIKSDNSDKNNNEFLDNNLSLGGGIMHNFIPHDTHKAAGISYLKSGMIPFKYENNDERNEINTIQYQSRNNYENNLIGGNNPNRVEWNDENNSYTIYSNSEIECIITNNDILKNMIDNNNIYIKKYIYTLSYNPTLEVNEFNFINSIFTSNLDIIIKLQNFVYDIINNNLSHHISGELRTVVRNHDENNEIKNDNLDNEILLFFYYQLIIWLFKNISIFENNDSNNSNKISKVFSTLTYRFSSLILKNVINVQKMCDSNLESLNEINIMKNEIMHLFSQPEVSPKNLSKFGFIKDLSEDMPVSQDELNNKQYNDNRSLSEQDIKLNETNNNLNNDLDNNILNKYKILNKNGIPIKKFKELFSENNSSDSNDSNNFDDSYDSDNSDNSNNAYNEISDTVDLHSINNSNNIKKLKEIEESIISLKNNSSIYSYNKNSALNNGKLFEI
jgi:hypothetical protein